MDPFDPIRRRAAELHELLVREGADPWQPLDLAKRAAAHLRLELAWLPPGDLALNGAHAVFDDQAGLISCASSGDPGQQALLVAHELGHAEIDHSSSECAVEDIDPSQSTEPAPVGLQRVEDYGARVRGELKANVFGRELLLPRAHARAAYLDERMSVETIASRLGLPLNFVRQQVLDALLLPQSAPAVPQAPPSLTDEPSQDTAAAHRGAPFLLDAGPGTGKTRTLVKRVESLVREGVDPASILILTFSNRAAGELAERLSSSIPGSARKMWIGTFHAFGLDLLRRFHDLLELPAAPILFDRSDAVEMLEETLPTLSLKHYRNLWDPAIVLRDILSAISRAKDEMVDTVRYRELAQGMAKRAKSPDEVEVGEKCLEIATVYERYEEGLRQRGGVDFGDLVKRPAELLRTNDRLRATVQLRHRHVLVDEYQDVNRASACLLKLVAGDGKRLWAVGDARQSIYRFRGASSANLRVFPKDYPGAATHALAANYRSHTEVVATFSRFARAMGVSKGLPELKLAAARGRGDVSPEVREFERAEHEAQGVADAIEELRKLGVPYRDQAVLCRSNRRLSELAATLEARSIPVLHLGSLFEREEIRDLLALLQLFVDRFGDSLLRVGAQQRYALSLQDCVAVTRHLREGDRPAVTRLVAAAEQAEGLTPNGKASLAKLAADIEGLSPRASAWDVLTTFLLDRTRQLEAVARSTDVRSQLQGIAIWQFLNFARDQSPVRAGQPIRRTLDRVRQMMLFAEERDLRQVPHAALGMDAVRLMTVHGSKGLEFDAVHIPGLNIKGFPASGPPPRCPVPDGMIDGAEAATSALEIKSEQEREEQSLFFVGLSRARKHLRLSLVRRQRNGHARGASPFLAHISAQCTSKSFPPTEPVVQPAEVGGHVEVVHAVDWRLTDAMIAAYAKCPRRFFYTHVIGLRGSKKPTAFVQTHDCIHEFLRWLGRSWADEKFDKTAALTHFDRLWNESGPTEHPCTAEYRRLADRLIGYLLATGDGARFRTPEPLPIEFDGAKVWVEPSAVGELAGETLVRQVRTGRKRKDEYERLEYILLHMASKDSLGSGYRLDAVHLSDESIGVVVPPTAKVEANRRETVNEMVSSIFAGDFPPAPDAFTCPRCPHFFICAATPQGALKKNS